MVIFKFLVIFGGMVLKLDTVGLIFSSSMPDRSRKNKREEINSFFNCLNI